MNLPNTLQWLRRHKVGVLKGGWSRERSISLKTGEAVEKSFQRMGVPILSIDVDRDISTFLSKKQIHFAFIALHGEFGEDGGIQTLLELNRIPYTGSGPLASGLAMDKHLSKQLFVQNGIPTADWITVTNETAELNSKPTWLSKGPVFVKPFDQGSAIGVSRVNKPAQLHQALKACFRVSKKAVIEKFIEGRELTVGILGRQALPVVEIIPEHSFYDFHSKYAAGGSRHLVPATLPTAVTKQAMKISMEAFDALGCTGYGRVDLLWKKNGGLFVLEVNTIPGMTATSLLPDAARASGISFDELVLRICALSLNRGEK